MIPLPAHRWFCSPVAEKARPFLPLTVVIFCSCFAYLPSLLLSQLNPSTLNFSLLSSPPPAHRRPLAILAIVTKLILLYHHREKPRFTDDMMVETESFSDCFEP